MDFKWEGIMLKHGQFITHIEKGQEDQNAICDNGELKMLTTREYDIISAFEREVRCDALRKLRGESEDVNNGKQ